MMKARVSQRTESSSVFLRMHSFRPLYLATGAIVEDEAIGSGIRDYLKLYGAIQRYKYLKLYRAIQRAKVYHVLEVMLFIYLSS